MGLPPEASDDSSPSSANENTAPRHASQLGSPLVNGTWWLISSIPSLAKWVFSAAALVIVVVLGSRLLEDAIIIEPMSVPKDLLEKGYTPEAIAAEVRDQLVQREDEALAALSRDANGNDGPNASGQSLQRATGERFYRLDGEDITFQVPAAGLSLQNIVEVMRPWFGIERPRISGAIKESCDTLRLSVRLDGRDVDGDLEARKATPLDLIDPAVTVILRETRPHIWLLEYDQPEEALEDAQSVAAGLSKEAVLRGDVPSSTEPFMSAIRFQLGRLASKREKRANELLDELYASLPAGANTSSWRQLCRSDIARLNGQPERAKKFAQMAIEMAPETAAPYLTYGVLLASEGDYEGAFNQYNKAIRSDPSNSAAYNNRGVLRMLRFQNFRSERERLRAVDDFDQAVKLNPAFAYAYINRASAHASGREFDLAGEDFARASHLSDNACLLYLNRAGNYFDIGEADLAAVDAEKAVSNCRDDPRYRLFAHFRRGEVLRAQGEFEEAIGEFNAALSSDDTSSPWDPEALANLGYTKCLLGDCANAIADLAGAHALGGGQNPLHVAIWLYLAEASAGRANAKARFRRTLTQLVENREAVASRWPYPMAKLFLGKLTPKDALSQATNGNERCEARFYIGKYQLQMGAKEDAIWNFEQTRKCPGGLIEIMGSKIELERLQSQGEASAGSPH